MRKHIRVVAICAGKKDPSRRFRIAAYRGMLKSLGVELIVRSAWISKYPPVKKWLRPVWLPASILGRVPHVLSTYGSEVTLFSREMVSSVLTLEPLTKKPRILDVDDAIWLHRGGAAVRSLAQRVDLVIAGNDFLANWFGKYNKNVAILPTPVDTARFRPAYRPTNIENVSGVAAGAEWLTIGWQGTSSNLRYLYTIEPALLSVLRRHPMVRLRIVCDRPPEFSSLPVHQIEYIPWSEQNEVSTIQGMSLGIMPLEDSDWTRGKCSYKMLLYMACGIPAVVSPVGMNAQILKRTGAAIGASSQQDWEDSLDYLLTSENERIERGMMGLRFVDEEYSLVQMAPSMAAVLHSVAGF